MIVRALAFARSSPWAALCTCGAVLAGVSALLGASMLSVGHLGGSIACSIGLFGLAREQRMDEVCVRPNRRAFVLLFAWVATGWVIQSWAYYWSGGYQKNDLGVFAHLLANLALRGSYSSVFVRGHGFADHVTPTLLLFTPLFAVAPSFMWLVAAKLIAFLACPWLLYLLGREWLGRQSSWLWLMPSLWLVHTVLAYGYLSFQFQPNLLAPPLALLAFLFATKQRWLITGLVLLVAAGLKEDQPLIGICLGIWLVLFRAQPRQGVAFIVFSTLMGVAAFWVVMPAFAHGGPLLQHSRLNPFVLWPNKLFLVGALLATVGALPLIHPRTLAFAMPAFAAHFASSFPLIFTFRYHHQVVPVLMLMIASLESLRQLQSGTCWWASASPRVRNFGAAAIISMAISLNGMLPLYSARLFWPTSESRAVIGEISSALPQLPHDRPLFTSEQLVPYLITHPDLHSFEELAARAATLHCVPVAHAVLLPTVQLPPWPPGRGQPEADLLDRATGGCYRVQSVTPHLRLYVSEAGALDGSSPSANRAAEEKGPVAVAPPANVTTNAAADPR